MRQFFVIAASVAVLLSLAGQAQSQANRTFVSGHGVDTNPCSVADPCRSFAQAITQTNTGGEITVLDSAGYGALAIDKSITITNPGGVEAGITATAGENAITINPSSSIVVTLRGLTLEGAGIGQNGIVLESTAPGTLDIIDCVVKDFAGFGIAITPSGSNSATPSQVLIANSFVVNNAASGIEISPQSGGTTTVDYSIDHTTVSGNTDAGILLSGANGFLSGTISSVHAQQNNKGVNFIGSGFANVTYIKNSVLTDNTISDLANNSSSINLYLFDSNQITNLSNGNAINSDNTNDIVSLTGNTLTPFLRM